MAPAHGVETLTPTEREDFEERAAILEYDANLSRDAAEKVALALVLQSRTW